MTSIWTSDNSNLWAIGERGLILHSLNGGSLWLRQESKTRSDLYGINGFRNGAALWIVGHGGLILNSSDYGTNWVQKHLPISASLHSICGSNDGAHLWIVGNSSTILRSVDFGETWTIISPPLTENLTAVACSNDGNRAWAVGERGTIMATEDGYRWVKLESGASTDLISIVASDDGKSLWTIGNEGTGLYSRSSGKKWEKFWAGRTDDLLSICATSNGKFLWIGTNTGTILHSSDGGSTWSTASSNIGVRMQTALLHTGPNGMTEAPFYTYPVIRINGLRASNDGSALWAVGDSGVVSISSDLGRNWTAKNVGPVANLWSIFTTADASHLWAVGSAGTILYSSDFGESWNNQHSGTFQALLGICGSHNGTQLWIVGEGGIILHSTDQGKTWLREISGTSLTLRTTFCSENGLRLRVAGSKGIVLGSEDGGSTWSILREPIQRTAMTPTPTEGDKTHGFNDIQPFRSTLQQQSSLPQDLYIDQWATDDVFSIFGSPEGSRLWVASLSGNILTSDDSGHSWIPVAGPGSTAQLDTFDYVSSITGTRDLSHLWAVGGHGLVYRSFDSGRHWIPSWTRSGNSLLRIQSNSDGSHLWALAAEGEVLQSFDGGESWDSEFRISDQHASSLFEAANGSKVFVVGRNGNIVEGNPANAYPHISEARLRRKLDSTLLDLKIDWPDGIRQNIDGWIVLRGANDFNQKQGTTKLLLSREIHIESTDPAIISLDISPAEQLGVSPGDKIHLMVDFEVGWHRRKFYLPTFTFDAWSTLRRHWLAVSFATLATLSIVFIFFAFFFQPLWLLSSYRHLGVYTWAQAKNKPFLVTLLSATVLPLLVTSRRVLHSWVSKYLPVIQTHYSNEPTVARSGEYAALPLKSQRGDAITFIERAEITQLAAYFISARVCWEIIGTGGAGKTTLASELGRKVTLSKSHGGFTRSPMIPVFIENDTSDLLETIRQKLQSYTGEELEPEILIALLKKQYILVVFDGLSERSIETQNHIRTVHGRWPINALVITSRQPTGVSGLEQVIFYPQPLDPNTLMYFIGLKLSQRKEAGNFADLKGQLLLASKIADLMPTKLEESALTPLLVTLFIEEAERLGMLDRDGLSKSIPDVYFNYLRRLNPQNEFAHGFILNDRMQASAASLAQLALDKTFVPKQFRKSRAIRRLQMTDEAATYCIKRLVANGVLRETTVGLDICLRFVLDPMAEFLAAWAFADECGEDQDLWADLWNKAISSNGQGFAMALLLVHKAFSQGCHWPELPRKVAHKFRART